MLRFIKTKEDQAKFWSHDDWKHVPAGEFRILGTDINFKPVGKRAPSRPGMYTFQIMLDDYDEIIGWRWVREES